MRRLPAVSDGRGAQIVRGALMWLGGASALLLLAGGYWVHQGGVGRADLAEARIPPAAHAGLSAEDRQTIWSVENRAFQLSYKFGPAFSAALARQDVAAVSSFFCDDFAGELFDPDAAEVFDRGFAEMRYQRATTHARRRVPRGEFIDWLIAHAGSFQSAPQVQLAVLYLAPIDRTALEGAWRGTWILRWTGEAARETPQQPAARGGTNELFPARYALADGEPLDITVRGQVQLANVPDDFAERTGWIQSWSVDEVAHGRAPHRLMEPIEPSSAGIDIAAFHDNWTASRANFLTTPGGVYANDYNRDGFVDLLVTDRGVPTLYAGRGGLEFRDVTLAAGLPLGQTRSDLAAFADLDGDGDDDLVLGTSLRENRDGIFVLRGQLPLSPSATGLAVADFDGDAQLDLYVSNSAPAPEQSGLVRHTSWINDESGVPNVLWRNRGDFQFEDVTESARAGAGHRSSFTSLWLDADRDGRPDLYVINELGPNLLLHNRGDGRFEERPVGPPFDGFTMGAAAGDLNEDGTIDLYLGNMKSKVGQRVVANLPDGAYTPEIRDQMRRWVGGNLLLFNRGMPRFDESAQPLAGGGWSYGTALADLDGDGRLDIHSTCGFASFSRREPDG